MTQRPRSSKKKEAAPLPEWRLNDSRELYGVDRWGAGFYGVNAKGNVAVHPRGKDGAGLDLYEFVRELQERDINLPVLIRFTDILQSRIRELNECFRAVIAQYKYTGRYCGVFPIKVNQHRQVVEDVLDAGEPYSHGLEAGTKPEVLLALAQSRDDSLIVCNGYKDREYVETALMGTKLGKKVFLVVEKLSELELIISTARRLGVQPLIGVRVKLHARGRGKWEGSGGDRSKFGLFVHELLEVVRVLRQEKMLDSFRLLHFHLGSQITDIRSIKEALRESTRVFVELVRMGVPLEYLDIGGGLAVDYDGSHTNFPSSSNYDMREYAADVVEAVQEACSKADVAEPNIISESGRAIVAHHSVLVFEILGSTDMCERLANLEVAEDAPEVLKNLLFVLKGLSGKNFQEAFHDALQYRDEGLTMFNLGMLTLEDRAQLESLFFTVCLRLNKIISTLDYIPDELEGLERFLCDTYFGNFSVFKSVPDHWAIKQHFPIMPLHRLLERPVKRGIIADITCDSDGKIDQFVDLRDVKETLELHALGPGEPYFLGVFLVGAYQEVLGDFHNLFGDTNVVHIKVHEDGGYEVDRHIQGDTVEEVMGYVGYDRRFIVDKFRQSLERAVRAGHITLQDSATFRRVFTEGLEGYTYLER